MLQLMKSVNKKRELAGGQFDLYHSSPYFLSVFTYPIY